MLRPLKGRMWNVKDSNDVILVKLFLLSAHVHTEDLLHLCRQRFFHVFFDTSEQEGLEDFVKTLIAIITSFTVLVLKILPWIKPAVHNRDRKCHLHPVWASNSCLLKVLKSTHLSGMRKCNSDHSSLREFCSGVPVMRSLWLDLNSINVLYSRESSFFNLWASSTPMKAQLMFPSTPWRTVLRQV